MRSRKAPHTPQEGDYAIPSRDQNAMPHEQDEDGDGYMAPGEIRMEMMEEDQNMCLRAEDGDQSKGGTWPEEGSRPRRVKTRQRVPINMQGADACQNPNGACWYLIIFFFQILFTSNIITFIEAGMAICCASSIECSATFSQSMKKEKKSKFQNHKFILSFLMLILKSLRRN